MSLLCVQRVDEVPDLNCSKLSLDEMNRILLMRSDLGEFPIQRIMEYLHSERAKETQEMNSSQERQDEKETSAVLSVETESTSN